MWEMEENASLRKQERAMEGKVSTQSSSIGGPKPHVRAQSMSQRL